MITDHRGSYCMNVSMLFKQIALYAVLVLLALMVFSIVAISVARTEIKDIDEKKAILHQEFKKTMKINASLNHQIHQRLEEMNIAGDRIDDLEDIIGVSKPEDAVIQGSFLDRIDVANITGTQKAFIMKFIPNGFPLDQYVRISASFGSRIHPIFHILHHHSGMDFSTKTNTPIYATADGVVEFGALGWNGGYGNLVRIAHSFGFKTYYAHLNSILVHKYQFVKKGQIIAYSGNTGASTGSHLHYEVRFLNTPINPYNFAKWNMKNFDFIFEKERIVAWQSLLALISNLMLLSRQELQPLSHRGQK
ncbi:M23 family peptidase [Helicobacter mustelae]|nr:M23 family peptidase [Helicobacter mustelae]STP12885.1 M23 family peptidase [Helicobacter mustelae]